MVMGVFVIRCEGCEVGDEPADVGVVLEGVTALEGLGNVANGVALLVGLIYALNLSYPKEFRYTFELLQKCSWSLMDTNSPPKFKPSRPSFLHLIKGLMNRLIFTLKLCFLCQIVKTCSCSHIFNAFIDLIFLFFIFFVRQGICEEE